MADVKAFRDTMLIVACFNLALMFPACFWVKARLPPRHPPPLKTLKRPLTEVRFVFLVIGTGLYGCNILTPYFNAQALAVSNDCSPSITNYAVAILQAGSFVGRVVAGIMADRFGVWNVFGCIPFLTSITMFAFWTPPNVGDAPTLLGLLFYGIFSGGWFTVAASATAVISPLTEIGMRIGMMWSSVALPGLIGPVISGGEYHICLSCFILTFRTHHGRKCQVHLRWYLLRVHLLALWYPHHCASIEELGAGALRCTA